jgi:hypothetical protein
MSRIIHRKTDLAMEQNAGGRKQIASIAAGRGKAIEAILSVVEFLKL